jgi:hypothetical protein
MEDVEEDVAEEQDEEQVEEQHEGGVTDEPHAKTTTPQQLKWYQAKK